MSLFLLHAKFSQENMNHYNNAFDLATNIVLKNTKIGLKQHIFLLQLKCSLSAMSNTITNSEKESLSLIWLHYLITLRKIKCL